MRNITIKAVVTAFILALAWPALAADEITASVESFFSPIPFRNAQLSPDGRHVAAISRHFGEGTALNLVVIDLDKNQSVANTGFTIHDVFYFIWISPRHILYSTSYFDATSREYELPASSYILDIESSKAFQADARLNPVINLASFHVSDNDVVVVDNRFVRSVFIEPPRRLNYRTRGTSQLRPISPFSIDNYKVEVLEIDAEDGGVRIVQKNDVDAQYWVSDVQNQYRAALATEGDPADLRNALKIMDSNGQWRTVARFDAGDLVPLKFDPSGDLLYVAARNRSDKLELFRFDISTNNLGPAILSDANYDIYDQNTGMRHLVTDNDGRPVFYEYMADKPETHYFDPRWQAWQNQVDALIPDRNNRLVGWDNAYRRFLVQSESDRSEPSFRIFNAFDNVIEFTIETPERPDPSTLATMESVWIPVTPEISLHSYLFFHDDAPLRLRPTVIMLNDFAFDDRFIWEFHPMAQAIAANGYNVMLLDRRGSSGYGKAMQRAGWGEIGDGLQDDIATAIDWAVESNIAPAGEICLMGHLYGGFATIKAVADLGSRVRCGVVIEGVINLSGWYRFAMTPQSPFLQDLTVAYREARIGSGRLPAHIKAPHKHLSADQGSLLVIYRDVATGVDAGYLGHDKDSHWLLKQLRKKDLPHETFIVEDFDNLTRQFQRDQKTAARVIKFLQKNLPVEESAASNQ